MISKICDNIKAKLRSWLFPVSMCSCTEPEFIVKGSILKCRNCDKPVYWQKPSTN